MADHVNMLQRVLPLLRDAHACVSGLPFDGTPQGLRVELGLAVVKVETMLRAIAADDIYDPADRFAFDTAIATRAAMDSGAMPFDQQVYDAARSCMLDSFRRGLAKQAREPSRPPKRAGKH